MTDLDAIRARHADWLAMQPTADVRDVWSLERVREAYFTACLDRGIVLAALDADVTGERYERELEAAVADRASSLTALLAAAIEREARLVEAGVTLGTEIARLRAALEAIVYLAWSGAPHHSIEADARAALAATPGGRVMTDLDAIRARHSAHPIIRYSGAASPSIAGMTVDYNCETCVVLAALDAATLPHGSYYYFKSWEAAIEREARAHDALTACEEHHLEREARLRAAVTKAVADARSLWGAGRLPGTYRDLEAALAAFEEPS